MDNMSYTVRIPKRWIRVALIVAATALIVAPLTAVATHSFSDVPNDNTFHGNIEWLQQADVTRGCNPPANTRYCPKDNVTREQMAAFMQRLAENRVVDAGTLEGKDSAEIMSRVWASNDSDGGGTIVSNVSPGDLLEINSIGIDAPAEGFLIISGSVFINPTTVTGYLMQPLVDGNAVVPGPDVNESGWPTYFQPNDGDQLFTLAYTVTVPISAGSHTVSQEVGPLSGSADFFYNKQFLTVQFVPAGTVETGPSSASSSGLSGVGS